MIMVVIPFVDRFTTRAREALPVVTIDEDGIVEDGIEKTIIFEPSGMVFGVVLGDKVSSIFTIRIRSRNISIKS